MNKSSFEHNGGTYRMVAITKSLISHYPPKQANHSVYGD